MYALGKIIQKGFTVMLKLWIWFIALMFLAIIAFVFINNDHEYKCYLPNRGYFKVKWLKDKNKFKVFKWQPKGNQKETPKNVIILQSDQTDEDDKDEGKHMRWKTKGKIKETPKNLITIDNTK